MTSRLFLNLPVKYDDQPVLSKFTCYMQWPAGFFHIYLLNAMTSRFSPNLPAKYDDQPVISKFTC
jgi:hypothetical protein